MTTMVLVGVASALAVFAITMRVRAGKPKKAEKREKARIVKRLLALSEREQYGQRDFTPTTGLAKPDPSPSRGGGEHFSISYGATSLTLTEFTRLG